MGRLTTLERTLEMLRMIPRYPRRIDTVTLRDRLNAMDGGSVTLRTIQRDLNLLSDRYSLVSDDSKPQGWSWAKDAPSLDIPGLDPQIAMVFKMVEAHLMPVLPATTLCVLAPWFDAAFRALKESGVPIKKWPAKVRVLPRGMPLLPPEICSDVQSAVYAALLDEKRLKVVYRAKGGETTRNHLLDPLAVVQRGALIYLVAANRKREQPFTLLLHRMVSAEVLDEPAMTLPGFDLDEYIASGELNYLLGAPVNLVLRLSRSAISAVTDTPLAVGQTIEECPDGWFEVRATVPNTVELRAWIRGFGDEAVLISPELSLHS